MEIPECRRLIFAYQQHRCLWDQADDDHKKTAARDRAWRRIAAEFGDIAVAELKRKMTSLLGGYRREKCRERQSRDRHSRVRSSPSDHYRSKWFAYHDFAFLEDKNDPGTTRDTTINEICEPLTDDEDNNFAISEDHASMENYDTKAYHQIHENNDQTAKSTFQTPGNRNARKRKLNNTIDLDGSDVAGSEAVKPPQQGPPRYIKKNPNYTFGQYISSEMFKYDPVTSAQVKNAISRILLEADMGKYEMDRKADDDRIFVEYLATVFGSVSSEGRRKLRRMIQRTIADVLDEEEEPYSHPSPPIEINEVSVKMEPGE